MDLGRRLQQVLFLGIGSVSPRMIVTVCYKVDTWAKAGSLYVISPTNWNDITVDMYSNFHAVASNIRQIHSLVAFNTILTWFKAVKYINIIPYVTTFMQTVSISQQNLGSWIVVFTSTLVGFVLAFSTAFGGDVSELRTPFQAFVFIMLTILGNSNLAVIYAVAPLLGSLLIMMYVVSIFFVIMNLFYAIIVSTLSDAKIEEDAKQKKKWGLLQDWPGFCYIPLLVVLSLTFCSSGPVGVVQPHSMWLCLFSGDPPKWHRFSFWYPLNTNSRGRFPILLNHRSFQKPAVSPDFLMVS